MKILIYTPIITPRIRYAFNLFFRDILLVTPEVTAQREDFIAYDGAKLSYCDAPLKDELFFKASSLLFEKDIKPVELKFEEVPEATFDIFASSFYLTSRYEEYLPHKTDVYQRFAPAESVAYKNNFLHKPMVNIWAEQIKNKIERRFPVFHFPKRTYKFIPTIDVDNAYAYRGKGFARTSGAYARSLLKMNFSDISERTQVLLGKKNDPYDVFEELIETQKKYNFKPIYFFLLADYGLNDKNVPHTNKKFQSLIKSISDYADVGIHPSFNSYNDKQKLKTEISRLSEILHKDVTKSRQHFLKIKFPDTYKNLIQLGITDDYTMGYTSEMGFRAGICTPFYFYDLQNDKETNLKIHPFCLMEATLKYYKNSIPENAITLMKPLIDEVKKVKGTLYTLWHNEFFSNQNEFTGWKNVFEEMVEYAVMGENPVI